MHFSGLEFLLKKKQKTEEIVLFDFKRKVAYGILFIKKIYLDR